MTETILVVDDDDVSRMIIEKILLSDGYQVYSCSTARRALEVFQTETCSLILSDYFMPEMDGKQLLKAVRNLDSEIPFIFLTTNTNVTSAVELLKRGADDYIPKPIVREELVFRIRKTMREKENEKLIEKVRKEKELLDLENKRLVNWRTLYAAKDIRQTEQLIHLLSRTINQSGGFLWLDMLEGSVQSGDEDNVSLSTELYQMILSAARSQKEIFDYITFISSIDTLSLNMDSFGPEGFLEFIRNQIDSVLFPLARKYNRYPLFVKGDDMFSGTVRLDAGYLSKILKEVMINAIKYSPEESRIFFLIEKVQKGNQSYISIVVRNVPRQKQKSSEDGTRLVGIPYEYSELVFDVFYTIDAFPSTLEEEEWSDGTGLYVCRKLLRRQNAWIETSNGIDYTGDSPETFVKFTILYPYS